MMNTEDSKKNEVSSRHLASAFLMEAVAAARNEIAALKAHSEGRAREALLFRALALAERVHWNKALMLLRGKILPTDENLVDATQTLEEAVGAYKTILEETEGPAKGLADQFLRTTRNHLGLLRRFTEKPVDAYFVCQICGFIASDKEPERCPVCQALQEKFKSVE